MGFFCGYVDFFFGYVVFFRGYVEFFVGMWNLFKFLILVGTSRILSDLHVVALNDFINLICICG